MKMTRWLTLGLCASGVLSVFAELPEGYTELEYIKGTSGGNQRILTDYIPSSTDRFVAEIKVINTYTTQALWCSRGTNTADRTMTCFMMTASSKFIFRGDRKNVAGTYGTFWATGYKIIDADYSTGKFYADSALDLTMSSGDFTPVGKLAFFASYVNGGSWANYGLYELHSFKIYNAEGVLVRNFVPARDDSAAANAITRYGLYETCVGKFYPNASEAAAAFSVQERYILNVPAGEDRELTSSDYEAFKNKSLIKIGAGRVVGRGDVMTNFCNVVRILDGVYSIQTYGGIGTGSAIIVKGGTLENHVAGQTEYITGGYGYASCGYRSFLYFEGEGYNGYGAISNCVYTSNFACPMIVTGDALVTSHSRFEQRYQSYKGQGHTVTIKSVTSRDVSSPILAFTADTIRAGVINVYNGGVKIDDTSDNALFEELNLMTPGSCLLLRKFKSYCRGHLTMVDGICVEADQSVDPYQLNKMTGWSGLVSLPGMVTNLSKKASGVTSVSNNVFAITGPVEGNGGFVNQNDGWLHLAASNNTFAGGVELMKGGLGVFAAGALPPDGAPLKLHDSTIAYFCSSLYCPVGIYDYPRPVEIIKVPDVIADGNSSVDATGAMKQGTNITVKSILKTGEGALLLDGPVSVLGRTDIEGGTLRLGERHDIFPGLAFHYDRANSGSNESLTEPRMGIDSMGVRYAYNAWPKTSGEKNDPAHVQGLHYAGYINVPGEPGTQVNCNFISSMGRGCVVRVDGQIVQRYWDSKNINNESVGYGGISLGTNLTLTAGWHKLNIKLAAWWQSDNGPYANTTVGWQANFGLGVDWQGRGTSNIAHYVKLVDPGDGSFLRAIGPSEVEKADALSRPSFAGPVRIAAGATIDLGGSALTLNQLSGLPSVTNGTLTVGNTTLEVKASDLEKGIPMTVENGAALVLPSVVTIDIADPENLTKRLRGTRPLVSVAPGGSLSTTKFVVSDRLRALHYRIVIKDGIPHIESSLGFTIILR